MIAWILGVVALLALVLVGLGVWWLWGFMCAAAKGIDKLRRGGLK